MYGVSVLRLHALEDLPDSLLQQVEEMEETIRLTAEQFSQARPPYGGPFDDWLRAERRVCWLPQAELTESETAIHLLIAVPGMDAAEIQVTLLPTAVIVLGNKALEPEDTSTIHFSDFGARRLFRKIDLPRQIHVDSAVVAFEKNMLKLSAAKIEPIAAAMAAAAA